MGQPVSTGPRYPTLGQPWAFCPHCGLDTPSSEMLFNSKYGWQCTRVGCFDQRPDRDDYLARRRFRIREGDRTKYTKAPIVDALEGIDTNIDTTVPGETPPGLSGYGEAPYGEMPFGGAEED